MTTAIYFDLDGTLLSDDQSDERIVVDVLEGHVSEPDAGAERFLSVFEQRFEAHDPEPYRAGLAAVLEDTENDTDPEDLVAALRTAECEYTCVNDAARESLAALGENNTLVSSRTVSTPSSGRNLNTTTCWSISRP